MFAFRASDAAAHLEVILDLIQAGDPEGALAEIRELVATLKIGGETDPIDPEDDGVPEPWRIVAAHLKAAEVQIEQTHMSPAEESVAKAIYAATHPPNQASGAQLNV